MPKKKRKISELSAIEKAQRAVAKHVYMPPSARKKIEAQKKKNFVKGKSK